MGHPASVGHGYPCRAFVAQSAGAGYHQEDRDPSSTSEYGSSGEQGSDRRWPDPAAPRSNSTQGGVITTTLRALVAEAFCLPSWESWYPSRLVGPFSSVLARPTQRRSSRADHTSGKLSWCRRRFCHEPQTKGSHLSLWRRRNSLFYAARIRFSGIDRPTLRAIWSERLAGLLIPHKEGDAELCPNEKKMVDESRFFSGHVWGGMDKPF